MSNTACHVASSTSRPSPNAVWTSSATLSQLDASIGDPPLLSVIFYPPIPSGPSVVLSFVRFFFLASTSSLSFLFAAASYPFRYLARIPEVPPER